MRRRRGSRNWQRKVTRSFPIPLTRGRHSHSGEILHHAGKGCRTFVILQPFGCLPNHVVGRGISKKIKEIYPDAQILPLDYDPDVSFANIENRLQMLVMNIKK